MTTTITAMTNDLKDQLQAAQHRQKDLAAEHAGIDQQIQEAARQAARQKAEAARNNETLGAVAADMDIEELRRRREALPFELWAARITMAQLARDLHRAELEEAEAESEKASSNFASAQREAQDAEKARDLAYTQSATAGQRVFNLRRQLKETTRTIQALEKESPGA